MELLDSLVRLALFTYVLNVAYGTALVASKRFRNLVGKVSTKLTAVK